MKSPSYRRVNGETDHDSLDVDESINEGTKSRPCLLICRSVSVGIAVGFALSLAVLMIYSIKPKDICTRKMSTWSPALEIYDDDELSVQRFDGALRKPNKFRGPPSQEIDDAWDEITYSNGILVRLSKDQLDRVNASGFAAEYTEDMGGGYMAGIEVFHQLHCLNMLRKATYMDYYLPKNEEWKDQETLRYHLRQSLRLLQTYID